MDWWAGSTEALGMMILGAKFWLSPSTCLSGLVLDADIN
jgi:hypothetical protein